MRRAYLTYAGLFAGIILSTGDCGAESKVAIGLTGNVKRDGFLWGAASGETAEKTALGICRGTTKLEADKRPEKQTSVVHKSCKIVATFNDQCFVVVIDGDQHTPATAVGWAVEADSATARRKAAAKCEATADKGHGVPCKVNGTYCDGSAK
jgi:hypothetical protein